MEKTLLSVETPCYITDERELRRNLEILQRVEHNTGCHILLAQKAYSQYQLYPLIGEYISGTTASGLFEARLGHEHMGGLQTHVFAPAYTDGHFRELTEICDHITFNSIRQYEHHKKNATPKNSLGLRVNPECSTQGHGIYDPCSPYSRLGVVRSELDAEMLEGIEGLHFHTLCEQNADALEVTLAAFEEKFGEFLPQMKWVNFGGGHHITREDYDIKKLEQLITNFKQRYDVEVYLEPGEAVALNSGYLVASVLDIVHNGMDIAILDASAACHMPDVLEVPYTPKVMGADENGQYRYRFGGNTCLAGDIIGDYAFAKPLEIGDKVIFLDMAIYSTVKNNTFNGIPLPSIGILRPDNSIDITKQFGYNDFKSRL